MVFAKLIFRVEYTSGNIDFCHKICYLNIGNGFLIRDLLAIKGDI